MIYQKRRKSTKKIRNKQKKSEFCPYMRPFITHILLAVCLIGLLSCNKEETSSQTSDIAKLKAFWFADMANMPGLAEATFKIDERLDTGLVTNQITKVDSMRYGTSLKRVVPKFSFEASPGSVTMELAGETVNLSGSDTLDFTKTPIYLTIQSSDMTVTKTYEIKTTVHTMDPDLYKWQTLTPTAYLAEDEDQQVVIANDTYYWFSNNGFSTRLYVSNDAMSWSEKMLSGLPKGCHVKGIMQSGDKLYYADSTHLYTSDDVLNWTAQDYSSQKMRMVTMLMSFNDTAWLVVADSVSTYHLGKIVKDSVRMTDMVLDKDFPVSGFSTVTFESFSGRKRALIIGGYTRDGQCTNSRWSIEYAVTIKGLYRLMNYSMGQTDFTTLTGASIIWYKDRLLLFGGVNADMEFLGRDILYSKDEGYTWSPMDTKKCAMPDSYTARQKQTVLVYNNNIYVFGGQDLGKTYTEVYCGRLNSINWPTE